MQRGAAAEDETLVTEKISGKPARALANRFIREMEAADAPQLVCPAQNTLTGPLRAAAKKTGRHEFPSLYAGQPAALACALPAGELAAQLNAEALDRLAALRRQTSPARMNALVFDTVARRLDYPPQ